MHTLYVPPSQIHTNIATITGSEQHHLRNVLRITSSEIIRIIDGQGNIYTAEVLNTDTNRPSSEARILTHEFRAQVPPSLTLFQGLPKNDKMALILQKNHRTWNYTDCADVLSARFTKTEPKSI